MHIGPAADRQLHRPTNQPTDQGPCFQVGSKLLQRKANVYSSDQSADMGARAMLSDMYGATTTHSSFMLPPHAWLCTCPELPARSHRNSIISIRHDLNAFHDHASPLHKCNPPLMHVSVRSAQESIMWLKSSPRLVRQTFRCRYSQF